MNLYDDFSHAIQAKDFEKAAQLAKSAGVNCYDFTHRSFYLVIFTGRLAGKNQVSDMLVRRIRPRPVL